ncbi:hypothetical protein RhiirA4_477272 [Rhizophagus irregularis]|uniref:Uncharacterized protein n=1 Tax=Rhizophagus irregularis TaxID=588596 RepID=A0A2I1HD40_9GLOM|nr:hypothetical protein RhiirA4_477272 [Rhizophagus irregularis]
MDYFYSNKDFGIMTKILGITTDNASNNNTFLEEVSHELAEKNIEFDNVNQHVYYLAHIINLAAQEALKSLKATVNTNEDEFLKQHKNMQNTVIIIQVGVVGSIYVKARELKEPLNTLSNSDTNLHPFTLEAASNAIILDPRLKIQYMKDKKWDKRWIESAKKKVQGKYAPIEINNISNEYNSSDEDLITHIFKRQSTQGKGLFRNPSNKCTFGKDIFNVVTSDRAPETIAIMCLKHWYNLGILD